MLKDIFGAKLVQLGMLGIIVAVIAGVWWQGEDPADPADLADLADKTISDGEGSEPGTVAVSDGSSIEAATYAQPDSGLGVAGFGSTESARPLLDGGPPVVGAELPGSAGDELRSIPQNEPGPLEGPPSFDSAVPIARTAPPAVETGGLPERGVRGSTTGHPLLGSGAAAVNTVPLTGATVSEPTLELPAPVTVSSPPSIPPPAAAGGLTGSERGWEYSKSRGVAGGETEATFGPRTLAPSRKALPIASESAPSRPFVSGAAGSTDLPERVHTIQSGDSYWTISRQYYGTARYFQALSAFNRVTIPDPRRMRPGMKVAVPTRELLESRYATTLPKSAAAAGATRTAGFQIDANGHPVYAVGADDTLTGIARTHLGRTSRWIQIYRMNRDQLPGPHKLKPGTVLRMPADAARLPGEN
jgi:nucleoid-associated protein YgaU